MKKVLRLFPLIAVVAALSLLSGCAAICGVEEQKPAPAPPPPPPAKELPAQPEPVTEKPEPPKPLPTTYTVEKCDDLYSISAKPQIYNDPWLWPLLWDANKDKIKDPNKIWEGTVLSVPRGVSDAEMMQAREQARKFPKYIPPAGAKRYCPPK